MAQSERAPPGVQQHIQGSVEPATGRTVRELVEKSPELVTDSWCRQVAADLLHALEARQALDRPHSIIMPDTVIVHAGGAAELLAALDDDDDFPAAFHPPVASDLQAIAALLHYAITGESPPGAALVPRGLPAFSDALLDTIDACLHGERSRRPQAIDAMRAGLGLALAAPVAVVTIPMPAVTPMAAPVSAAEELEAAIAGLAEAVGAGSEPDPEPEPEPAREPPAPVPLAKAAPLNIADSAPPVPQPAPVPPPAAAAPATHPAPPARLSRALLACLAIGILGAAAFAIYEKGRQAGAEAVLAANAVAPATPAVVAATPPVPAPSPALEANRASDEPAPTSVAAPAAVSAAPVATTRPAASVTYKLNIRPWGEVYVDGVKRGVSPPLKTLTLRGNHTVRIDNPDFPSRTISVQPGTDTSTRIEHDFQ